MRRKTCHNWQLFYNNNLESNLTYFITFLFSTHNSLCKVGIGCLVAMKIRHIFKLRVTMSFIFAQSVCCLSVSV